MPSIERIVLVAAVLVVLLTTTVGVTAAAPSRPNEHANPVSGTAHTNQPWMQDICLNYPGGVGECASGPLGNGAAIRSSAHFWNGP